MTFQWYTLIQYRRCEGSVSSGVAHNRWSKSCRHPMTASCDATACNSWHVSAYVPQRWHGIRRRWHSTTLHAVLRRKRGCKRRIHDYRAFRFTRKGCATAVDIDNSKATRESSTTDIPKNLGFAAHDGRSASAAPAGAEAWATAKGQRAKGLLVSKTAAARSTSLRLCAVSHGVRQVMVVVPKSSCSVGESQEGIPILSKHNSLAEAEAFPLHLAAVVLLRRGAELGGTTRCCQSFSRTRSFALRLRGLLPCSPSPAGCAQCQPPFFCFFQIASMYGNPLHSPVAGPSDMALAGRTCSADRGQWNSIWGWERSCGRMAACSAYLRSLGVLSRCALAPAAAVPRADPAPPPSS